MLQRVFVEADVLASPVPFVWLALLRDDTDGAFQLHSSAATVTDAVGTWVAKDPAVRGPAASRRLERLTATLDEIVDVETAEDSGAHVLLTSRPRSVPAPDQLAFEVLSPDEFLCLLDDSAPAAVRRVAQLQHRAGRRDGSPADAGPADELWSAGCAAFAERVASRLST